MGRGFLVLKEYRDLLGDDAVRFQQLNGVVICRLKRSDQGSSPMAIFRSGEMATRLGDFLSARSEALAETTNLSGRKWPTASSSRRSLHPRPDRALWRFARRAARTPTAYPANWGRRVRQVIYSIAPLRQRNFKRLLRKCRGGGSHIFFNPRSNLYLVVAGVTYGLANSPAIALSLGIESALAEYIFQAYRVILLCDGLDELRPPTDLELFTFSGLYKQASADTLSIVSTRHIEGASTLVDSDAILELLGLLDSSVSVLLSQIDNNNANKIIKFLNEDKSILELFRNPLSLTLLPQLFGSFAALPDNKDALIDAVIDTLLYRHDAIRDDSTAVGQTLYDLPQFLRIFATIALLMVAQNKISMSRVEFTAVLERALDLETPRSSGDHHIGFIKCSRIWWSLA